MYQPDKVEDTVSDKPSPLSCASARLIMKVLPVRIVPLAITVPNVDPMEATVFPASVMATLTFATGRQAGV